MPIWWVDTFAYAPAKLGQYTIGGLYAGTSYVYCASFGGEVRDQWGNHNYWWMWTDLDVGLSNQGWVSAYYLSRWGDNQVMDNWGNPIPDCHQ